MSTNITFIINPASGFGKTKKKLKTLVKEVRARESNVEFLLTRHPLHAISLTKDALRRGATRIVVVGGDGTLNEVVNGFFDKDGTVLNQDASLAIIPSGSGSDFYRSLKQRDTSYIERALYGDAKPTDVGLVEAHDANGEKVKRYFINASSVGLSGLVAGFMKTVTKRLGAKSAYFIATVQAIRALTPPTLRISGGGVSKTVENCSLATFANGKYFGSGMKIAPNAVLDDGLLDVITINNLSAMFFLVNGYRVYQGTHTALDNVTESKYQECVIESLSTRTVYVETDGELFAQLPARYFAVRHAIKMVR